MDGTSPADTGKRDGASRGSLLRGRGVDSRHSLASEYAQMTIEWLVPLGQARAMTMALQSLASDIRTMRGCCGCSVSTELAKSTIVRYVEEWQTEADLREHVRSDAFLRLMVLIEDATAPPRIEFVLASVVRGLEYVAEVRRPLM